jgi:hypothetical protein
MGNREIATVFPGYRDVAFRGLLKA